MPSDPVETDSEGRANFNDVPLGYYEITEAALPAGYIVEGEPKFYVKVDAQGIRLLKKIVTADGITFNEVLPDEHGDIKLGNVTLKHDIQNDTVIFEVGNTPGAELPMTGGSGTYVFTLAGAILMVAAAAMILLRRPRLAHADAPTRRVGRKGGLR